MDRGEGRVRQGREGNVIEARHGELLGNGNTKAPAGLVDAEGRGIGHGHDGRGALGGVAEEVPRGPRPSLDRADHGYGLDARAVEAKASLAEGPAKAREPPVEDEGEALLRLGIELGPEGHDDDVPVPQVEDVAHEGIGRGLVVDADVDRGLI